MKKKSLLLVLVSLFTMMQGVWADEIPQVIWCWESRTLYFINSETEYDAGDSYNGERVSYAWSGDDVVASFSDTPVWQSRASDCTKVVFDESFASVRPTSCKSWFQVFAYLSDIVGIENLNTSEVTTMSAMFQNCHRLTSIDLSGFDTKKVNNMRYMFDYCENLKTIYVSEDWTVENVSTGSYMFSGDIKLMGEKGTTLEYVKTIDDAPYFPYTYSKYARIDGGKERPGYLTLKRVNVALDEAVEGNDDIIATNDGVSCNMTLTRSIVPGTYNTLCLPFDVSGDLLKAKFGDDVELAQLSETHMEDGTLYFDFTSADAITAGTPYLIYVSEAVENPIQLNGVTISNTLIPAETTLANFIPVFDVTTLDNGNENVLFLGANNTLYYPSASSGDMKGFRAYFEVKGEGQGAKMMVVLDNSLTGIKTVLNENLQNENVYDLQGRMVNNPEKGVYIVNGKKVIIK